MKGWSTLAWLLAGTVTAAAEPAPVAFVDEIVLAGGVEPAQARAFTVATLRRGGLEPRFADSTLPGCGDVPRCLQRRARSEGAAVAVRLTIVEVGAGVVVSVLVSDARGEIRRETVPSADLGRPDERIANLLREVAPRPAQKPKVAAWSLVGLSAALALGGSIATWHAYDLRSSFFADHIDANGDVVGISPADARAEERHARRWSYLGGIALGGAALGGVSATILFVRGDSGETRPSGVAVAWELR